jgi:hypothetical protein
MAPLVNLIERSIDSARARSNSDFHEKLASTVPSRPAVRGE